MEKVLGDSDVAVLTLGQEDEGAGESSHGCIDRSCSPGPGAGSLQAADGDASPSSPSLRSSPL